jgi:molybdenum cofactor biosynthesis protein B
MAKKSSTTKKHRVEGPKSVTAAIVTVSDTRTYKTDESGRLIEERLIAKGHRVVRHGLCLDEPSKIEKELRASLATGCDVIIFNGGTGIAPRDVTIETIAPRLEKRIDGFGELFRQLSYEEIGGAAMLSRAMAGTCQSKVVFCLPGSPDAVQLAMDALILPEINHVVGLLKWRGRLLGARPNSTG